MYRGILNVDTHEFWHEFEHCESSGIRTHDYSKEVFF